MSFDLKLENGNLKLNPDGKLATVVNTEKLRQDILKIIVTPVGGNKANPWYGCDANKFLIGNLYDLNFAKDSATEQLRSSIENLKALQQKQLKTQFITASESIASIKDIYINTNAVDRRALEVKVSILSYALTTLDVNFLIKL
jgi:hypothetical protein